MGRGTGVSVYIRDVTRRIESERALTEATKMAALGAMAGAIAHHFNNVLGGLVTSADFAQSSDDPDLLRRVLKSIVNTLTRASQLTQALLAFAEGDHSDSELADVGETVRQFIETVEPKLTRSGIRVEAQIAPVRLRIPARRLRTVLDCLTANACEAMPEGGTLRIEICVPPDATEMLLRITDTGAGMSEFDLRHAFEPFFTTKCEGTPGSVEHPGLGLAVVHGIIRSLGGAVTLASNPGEGTCCTIHLPLSGPHSD
jgi:C4-dicarboxylate-specific signal transduction histidine kinase